MKVALLTTLLLQQAAFGHSQHQPHADQAPSVEEHVVYGWYSGLALLMDVYHPHSPNGHGIVFVPGTGWHTTTGYTGRPHTELVSAARTKHFVDAGYTVFVPNLRMAPRFRYPAAVEDLQRAIRFIRHNSERFNVEPDRLGGWGGSSGGHLVALMGVMDGEGYLESEDPVERHNAKLQVVACGAGVFDLTQPGSEHLAALQTSFMGSPPNSRLSLDRHREASPITYVTPDDAAIFLVHGDADDIVPFQQSVHMEQLLRANNVETQLLRIAGGGHGDPVMVENIDKIMREVVGFFERHLLEQQ